MRTTLSRQTLVSCFVPLILAAAPGCGDDSESAGGGGAAASSTTTATTTVDAASTTTSPSATTSTTTTASTGTGAGGADCAVVNAHRFGEQAAHHFGAVMVGPNADLWIAGSESDEADFGGDPSTGQPTVTRLSGQGNIVWSTAFVASGGAGVTDVVVDDLGNSVAVGGFTGTLQIGKTVLTSQGGGDIFLVGLDPDGNVTWAQSYGDAGDAQLAVAAALAPDGTVVVGGWFNGSVDFGGGALDATGVKADVFVARFGFDGGFVNAERFGGADDQFLGSIAVAPDGTIVISGVYSGTPDFGGGDLPDGGDGFLLALAPELTWDWDLALGSAFGPAGVDATGNVHLVGAASGVVDFGGGPIGTAGTPSVVRLDLDPAGLYVGSQAWTVPAQALSATRVAVEPGGAIWVAGSVSKPINLDGTAITPAGGDDVFVARFEGDSLTFALATGSANDERARAVAIAPNGHAVVVGDFSDDLPLCQDPLTAEHQPDGFMIKLNP